MDDPYPPSSRRARHLGTWIAVVVVLVAMVLAAIVYAMVRPEADVQSPSADSSPERVVATYLQAMQVRDRGTMRDIVLDDELVPTWRDVLTDSDPGVTDVTLGELRQVASPTESAGAQWQQAVTVPAQFRVTRSGGGLVEGEESSQEYLLVRDGDDEPWQIAEVGQSSG
ncbi:hypothetical protein [Janibacter alittae]|uniref:DUF4829 domain-containing protein n=1 Tax=Janibacter alittae TaxID=3115209 RepID=A0ABZ2MKS5_9MICO